MKTRGLKYWYLGLTAIVLSGCYFPSTDFVKIEPVKYLPAPSEPIPNSQFGWIEVSPSEAQGYRVRIGNLTYKKIVEPYRVDGEIKYEAAVDALARFAVQKVIEAQYCRSAYVPENDRRLVGSQRHPEMWMYVECKA